MNRHMHLVCIFCGIFGMLTLCSAQSLKRVRGEGLYQSVSAVSIGKGTLVAWARGIGFIWDDDPVDVGAAKLFPFGEVGAEGAFGDNVSWLVESRIISYPQNKLPQIGYVAGGAKVSLFKHQKPMLHNFGFQLRYIHSLLGGFPSVAGYRTGGTGFNAEGFNTAGPNLEFKTLYDLDLISSISWLPLKLMANGGINMPLNADFLPYSQYLVSAGVSYCALEFDVFAEYSISAFVNTSFEPKKFAFDWGWNGTKAWEVAWPENQMFFTAGGRLRYDNGVILYFAVPLLLSTNVGSDITVKGVYQIQSRFPDEAQRGITDSFDPWYAKWKIVGSITFPIMFSQSSAEMVRSFILMKNKGKAKKIDIDEQLKTLDQGEAAQEKADSQKRLDEIKKKREEIEQGK